MKTTKLVTALLLALCILCNLAGCAAQPAASSSTPTLPVTDPTGATTVPSTDPTTVPTTVPEPTETEPPVTTVPPTEPATEPPTEPPTEPATVPTEPATEPTEPPTQPSNPPSTEPAPAPIFTLTLDEIRVGDIELSWPAYVTDMKNSDGTPVSVVYDIFIADIEEGPYYIDCEDWEGNSIYIAGISRGYQLYFAVLACVWCDGVKYPVAESTHVGYMAYFDENVITSSYDWNFDAAQMAEARAVAKSIADSIMADPSLTTDLARIAKAAKIINNYAAAGDYTTSGPYYNSPYGVFIAGQQSCAGCTRALGLILEYMGFQWGHVNPNAWEHQWCVVYNVDGQTAFADGSWAGVAGYGSWQTEPAYEYVEGVGLIPYTGSRPI